MKVVQSSKFKQDLKRSIKRGKNLQPLEEAVRLLISETTLPLKYRDHALTGNWAGWRDCHIEPDWLLIYKISPETLHLARIGTHSDLF